MDYSRTFGSNYPNECIALGSHKDIDNTVIKLINTYNSYIQNGSMTSAGAFYKKNKVLLEPYILNMDYINRLEEEIYNTGIYAMASNSSITSETEPKIEQNIGNYWFQDY